MRCLKDALAADSGRDAGAGAAPAALCAFWCGAFADAACDLGLCAPCRRKVSPSPDGDAQRIVFVDVDGVLNNGNTLSRLKLAGTHGSIDLSQLIDPANLRMLQRVVEATGAAVVVSSSWRLRESQMETLRSALAACGVRVIGQTPELDAHSDPRACRAAEIRLWLTDHGADGAPQWVAIDDLDLDCDGCGHHRLGPSHFVRTDAERGLTEADVDRAIAALRPAGHSESRA